MRIAMIGQRGVPALSGGVERHVEELGSRMAAAGHEVVVWCRSNYGDPSLTSYRGMELRHLPTVGTQKLDAIIPSLLASARSLRGFDVVHFHAIGPGVGAALPRARRHALVVQTIHGLDHERAKWSAPVRALLRAAAWSSGHVPHEVVVVSRALGEHYRATYGRAATYIPNGVTAPAETPPGPTLAALGLEPGRYALFVGRLVPEKCPDLLVRAFRRVPDPAARLVVVGESGFTDDYVDELRRLAGGDDRVVLAGARYAEELGELYTSAGVFVLPSSLEGLSVVLLEAAGLGLPVVVSDIAPNVEVVGIPGPGRRVVPVGDEAALAAAIGETLAGGAEVAAGAADLRADVVERYSWDAAAAALLDLYAEGRTRVGR